MGELAVLLTVIFFAFKVAGVASISWLFVFSPILIVLAIVLVLLFIGLVASA
jgi:hypothetical protein